MSLLDSMTAAPADSSQGCRPPGRSKRSSRSIERGSAKGIRVGTIPGLSREGNKMRDEGKMKC